MSIKLPKTVKRGKKRVGRGYGSGKGGHTAGRGQKGQKSRNKRHILFEGLKMKKSYIKRLPLMRGKGKFKARPKPMIIKLGYLNMLPTNSKVNIDTLVANAIVREKDARKYGVKVLGGGGDLKKKLTIEIPISGSAAKIVEKAGGKISLGEDEKITGKESNTKKVVKTTKGKKSK